MVNIIKILLPIFLIFSVLCQEEYTVPEDADISAQFMEIEVGQTSEFSIVGNNKDDEKWIWKNEKLEGNIIKIIEHTYDGISHTYKFTAYNPGNAELIFEYVKGNKTELVELVEINVSEQNELNKLIKQFE